MVSVDVKHHVYLAPKHARKHESRASTPGKKKKKKKKEFRLDWNDFCFVLSWRNKHGQL